MKRVEIPGSSQIKSVGYNWKTNLLEIEFHSGGIYQYADVPLNKWRELMRAESAGKYFNAEIKPYHTAVKVS